MGILLPLLNDEGDNSHGIISALKILKQWKEEYGLEYIAAIMQIIQLLAIKRCAIDIFFGTIGKLLPSFYVTGKETMSQAFGILIQIY